MSLGSPTDCTQCTLAGACVLSDVLRAHPGAGALATQKPFFKPGQTLRQEGEMADSLDVVKTGLVMLGQAGLDGQDKPLALVGRGHVLGVSALAGKTGVFWARAQSEVTLCRLPLAELGIRQAEADRHALVPQLYTKSLAALTAWTQVIRLPRLKQRVHSALALLVEAQGSTRIHLPRQADLAQLLLVTRESLGRALGELESEGALKRVDRHRADVLCLPVLPEKTG